MALIAPSLLAADFARLGEALHIMKAAGVPMLHLEVMDGHFVEEISVGQPVVRSCAKPRTWFWTYTCSSNVRNATLSTSLRRVRIVSRFMWRPRLACTEFWTRSASRVPKPELP